jgi:hypothetical protein
MNSLTDKEREREREREREKHNNPTQCPTCLKDHRLIRRIKIRELQHIVNSQSLERQNHLKKSKRDRSVRLLLRFHVVCARVS